MSDEAEVMATLETPQVPSAREESPFEPSRFRATAISAASTGLLVIITFLA